MENENSYEFVQSKGFIENLPMIPASSSHNFICFDLETSGFSGGADILQIAAKFGREAFNVYVTPTQEIDFWATRATGLRNINGELFFHNKKVHSVPLNIALMQFKEFLDSSLEPCILIAHNVKFDSAHLLRAIIDNNMIKCFTKIAGFSDSCVLLRKLNLERKGPGMFKLEKLAQDFLNIQPNGNFHEALYDVEILQKLVSEFIPEEKLIGNCQSYKDTAMMILLTPILRPMKVCANNQILKKLARAGLTPGALRKIYATGGQDGLREVLSQLGADNKPIITRNKVVMKKIIGFIEGH